jgi:hypothetical protein
MKNSMMSSRQSLYLRPLIAMVLATSGLLPLVRPVLAEGTAAGTNISNEATATYTDPNNPLVPISTTSNKVEVKVAEVAGLTLQAAGTTFKTDAGTAGAANPNDVLYYSYTITNVGNDPTQIRIPNLAKVTGPGTVDGPLEVSYNGGTNWVQISGTEVITPSQAPGTSVLVRVPVKVNSDAQPNDIVNVTLGDTPGDSQNQLRSPNGGDIYTVDNADGAPGEVAGAPVNGVREASDTQKVTVDAQIKSYTLATVLKVRSAYNSNNTPAITDDTLKYDLGLRVEDQDPTGLGITPAPLSGSTVPGLDATKKYILVSDAIPVGTDLKGVSPAPTGWVAVYTTTSTASTDANAATWTTTAPTTPAALAAVTRVGFVYDTTTRGPIAPGTSVTGLSIELAVEPTTTATTLTVANLAQLFGETPGNNGKPGTPVVDESGDQNPSNFGPQGQLPPGAVDTDGDKIPNTIDPDTGVVTDPLTTGEDKGNNNTGDPTNPTSPGGEANVFIIKAPTPSDLLNGPERAPDATGPDGTTNTDFTNKSAPVPAGTKPGDLLDPSAVAFTNTVTNNGTTAGTIELKPMPPAKPGDLPDGTKVTLTYGSESVSYTYVGGVFTPVEASKPSIKVTGVTPGQTINYGVEVNLPVGTAQSTDTGKGFPVPIQAGIDTNNDGTPDSTNTTIDRVYTGFLKLLKESRILPGTGPAPAAADTTFSQGGKTPAPGNIIEYRVTYTNITEPQSGAGNVILNADKVVITEDGVTGTNNWAKDNDTNAVIDTSNVTGSATNSTAATIKFFSGATSATAAIDQTGSSQTTDVTKYVTEVNGVVTPTTSGEFKFQRKVN